MPASFAADLCGYRLKNGNPNTSDNNDDLSVELGIALLTELGLERAHVGIDDPGTDVEVAMVEHLQSLRPDLEIRRSRPASHFDQYAHMAVFPEFKKKRFSSGVHMARLDALVEALPPSKERRRLLVALQKAKRTLEAEDLIVSQLKAQMPEESLLRIDLTCAEPQGGRMPLLHVALSSKWSLRTDRAQDCVSQGSKLVAQRRGRMPHYAAITMEPRPAMLKIIGDGSGAVDCIYHLDLPALTRAIAVVRGRRRNPETWGPALTFERLVDQGRLRDYDDLIREVERIPGPALHAPSPVPQGGQEGEESR